MKRLFYLVLVLASFMGAKAINQDSEGYYLLGSVQDWEAFSQLVANGNYAANARMTADIDLGESQAQIGHPSESPSFYYKGIFDGQGHTLTVHYVPTGANCLAPFPSISCATLKNLHIDGTIVNSDGYQPAAVGRIASGTSTLENIWSSLDITNTGSSWRECAGLVGCVDGYKGGHLVMKDCLYTGNLTSSGSYDGCFVGYINSGGSATVSNCLSTGTFTITGSSPAIRGDYTNCYILQFPATIPDNMKIADNTLSDGALATALQNGRSESVWVQDAVLGRPMLKVFATPQVPGMHTAYAIWCEDNATLYFDYLETGLKAGDTYDGHTVTAAWFGVDVMNSPQKSVPAWNTICKEKAQTVVFKKGFKEVRPTSLYAWFYNFSLLNDIVGIENLNTSNATTMASMFYYCQALTSIDVSHFDTKNVTNMQWMFGFCKSLKELNIDGFDISSLVITKYMFYFCTDLAAIYCDKDWFQKISAGSSTEKMFTDCWSLVGENYKYQSGNSNNGYFANTSFYFTSVAKEDIVYAIYCENNSTLSFDVIKKNLKVGHWYGDYKIAKLWRDEVIVNSPQQPDWSNSYQYQAINGKVTTVRFTEAFREVKPTSGSYWFYGMGMLSSIEGIENLNTSEMTSMDYMFDGCRIIKSLDLSSFNTSKVTTMRYMFSYCRGLKTLNLDSFDTSNVTNMYAMFSGCDMLKDLEIGRLNTSNVTNMSYMFNKVGQEVIDGCTIDLSNFDTSNVTDMSYMFENCGMITIDVSPLNTSNVTNMESMFNCCRRLKEIDISTFNTSNVTTMSKMFANCDKMTFIDLGSPDVSKLTSLSEMFWYCIEMTTIFCDVDMSRGGEVRGNSMFGYCSMLKGAISFESSKVNSEYANPTTGYFTPLSQRVRYTMPEAGIGTFSSAYNTEIPEGLTPYICVEDSDCPLNRWPSDIGSYVWAKETGRIVPKKTGILLVGEPGKTYTIKVTTEEAPYVRNNLLIPATDDTHLTSLSSDRNRTDLALCGDVFLAVGNPGVDNFLPAGHAYLSLIVFHHIIHIVFNEEDIVGVDGIEEDRNDDGFYYTPGGQRLAEKPRQSGIYIVGGKKVFIK